ncbi:helix-turn-helix domain-containing protein [Culturomica massiliensis]|uniref:helix-turn-helix domain-containing protein n=1 Tax=Culturomica massiliensis TaxID=1841857 RepID=UPI00266FF80D|nr:helix-turn-helix domain-containing protein [Culturomica massiliensis]
MSKPRRLADILKDYFQNSNEPLAVEFRKQFAGTDNPLLNEQPSDTPPEDWIDNQDVMQALHISPRTLQTLRSNGILPYSRIGNKLYYRKQDMLKILSDNYTMNKIKNYERNK